jgi:short-subunit dehydrogenase
MQHKKGYVCTHNNFLLNMNAIITGGSKGLGFAIACKLAAKGYNVLLTARDTNALTKACHIISTQYGVQAYAYACDLSKKENIGGLAAFCLNTFKEIHVLVNNAGVFLPGQIHKEEDGILESQIQTNLYSAYYLTRALISTITTSPNAHIINMCSIASKIAYPNGGSYSISKFALLGFSKVLREEMKPYGVKVTAIMPGAAWSDSWQGVELPYERLMSADDVATAVAACIDMSPAACVEEIILRPQLGDL